MKEITGNAMDLFKVQTQEAKDRLNKKLESDKLASLKDYNYNLEK